MFYYTYATHKNQNNFGLVSNYVNKSMTIEPKFLLIKLFATRNFSSCDEKAERMNSIMRLIPFTLSANIQ